MFNVFIVTEAQPNSTGLPQEDAEEVWPRTHNASDINQMLRCRGSCNVYPERSARALDQYMLNHTENSEH